MNLPSNQTTLSYCAKLYYRCISLLGRLTLGAPDFCQAGHRKYSGGKDGCNFGISNIEKCFEGDEYRTPVNNPRRPFLDRIFQKSQFKIASGHFRHFSIGGLFLPIWLGNWSGFLVYVLAGLGLILLSVKLWLEKRDLKRKLEREGLEKARASHLYQLKNDFYDSISHELRRPLTVILGMSQKAAEYFEEHDLVKSYQSLELIKRNSQKLQFLINQMLELSKMEFRTIQLELIQGNLVDFVRYVLESFHSMAISKNIRIHFLVDDDNIQMDYDPDRFQILLSNLLSNSLNYSPVDGDIFLEMRIIHESHQPGVKSNDSIFSGNHTRRLNSEFLQLKLRDSGLGVPAEEMNRILDDDNLDAHIPDTNWGSKYPAFGIGILLVKKLVRLMDGTIEVKSTSSKGTIYILKLPIRRMAHLENPAKITEKIENEKYVNRLIEEELAKIPPILTVHEETELPLLLIVEDNRDVAHYLVSCVEEDYSVVLAFDGESGIQRALELVPDIIISDVMMPEKDGIELCNFLKNDERTSHIPIVLLTAKADVHSRIEGLRQGADAYLVKPFQINELKVILEKLIELRENLQKKFSRANGDMVGGLRNETGSTFSGKDEEFMKKVYYLLDANLDNTDFNVVQMSRLLGLSRSQLYRKIKSLTGHSINLFIRNYRLQKGREMLNRTHLTIAEIAYEVGFSDPSYFTKAFVETFGDSPSAIRK